MIAVGAGASAAFVLGLAVAIATGTFGTEVHAWAPHWARRLVAVAARWYAAQDRQDFHDELSDLLECYLEDGRHLSGLTLAFGELRRSAVSVWLPGWILDDENDNAGRLVYAAGVGLAYGSVVGSGFGLAAGSLGGFTGAAVGLFVYGSYVGPLRGLVGGVAYGVVLGLALYLTKGSIVGAVAGLAGRIGATGQVWARPLGGTIRRRLSLART